VTIRTLESLQCSTLWKSCHCVKIFERWNKWQIPVSRPWPERMKGNIKHACLRSSSKLTHIYLMEFYITECFSKHFKEDLLQETVQFHNFHILFINNVDTCHLWTSPGAHPSILCNGYWVSFLEVKWPVRGVNHSHTSSVKVRERVELYLYSPSRPSWPILGQTSPLLVTYDEGLIFLFINSSTHPFKWLH
jgi:hypothetical protein